MTSNFRLWSLAVLVLITGTALAEDRMPWVADYNTACGMAAEQRRLVLLHFYNDNCGPCVRLEQNVFSKTEVADAVSQNYLAVKVHAGKNPQLATRYHINQWPTDVFVTASGLEVYRTVSPQKPAEYIALLNHVAVQSGAATTRLAHNPATQVAQQPVSAPAAPQANSYWQPALAAPAQQANAAQQAPTSYWQPAPAPAPAGQATTSQFQPQQSVYNTQPAATNPAQTNNSAYLQPAAGAVANGLSGAMAYAEQKTQQATSQTQSAFVEAQNKWNAATQQAQSSWDQARTATDNTIRQATATAEQTQQQWSATAQQTVEQATTAVQNTQQQATEATQQATAAAQHTTEAAKNWTDETTAAVQRYEQQMGDAYKQFRDRTAQAKEQVQQTSQQIQQQATATKQEWQATANQASQEVTTTAQNLKQQASALTSSLLDRRSSFMPMETSPAAPAAATVPAAPAVATTVEPAAVAPAAKPEVAATVTPPATPTLPSATAPAVTETPAITTSPAPAVTSNPWIANKQPEATKSSSFAPPLMSAEPSPSPAVSAPAAQVAVPPTVTAVPQQVAAAPSVTAPAPSAPAPKAAEQNFGNHQMVPVSQAPQMALDGFCPVTLMDAMSQGTASKGAWKKGSKQFGAIHNGRTYLFVSAENQQKFLTNPDAYAPALSGCDPVVFTERGQMVEGKRAYGIISPDKHMYLFADEASRSRFEQAPAAYTAAVQQAMARSGNLHR